jgi:L-ascorbate metabolism protein UlaG (beta-lactamase superfamily)
MDPTMSVEYERLTFDRPGHATVRIETERGVVVYIDPWSDVLDDDPGDGDLVFVTHDDPDHYDPDAVMAVAAPSATAVVYEEVDTSDLYVLTVELPYEGRATVGGVDVESVLAYNDPDGEHVDVTGAPFHAEGEVAGLLLTIEGTTVYYTSDTDFRPEHESVTADVLLPPIGGHYTMDRHEAAKFARSVEPDLVLPVHYDTFEAIETDSEAFVKELGSDDIRVELF